MSSFNQFGNVFQYGNSIKNIDTASNLHIGDVINMNNVANNNAETPAQVPAQVPAETPDLHWDWDWNQEEENGPDAHFWIAVMENPYISEPHCYGASIDFHGSDAIKLIERMRGKTGTAASEEIRKIWQEH